MKKRGLIIIMFICFLVSASQGEDVQKGTPEHGRYLRDGAKGKLTLKIVDENGVLVGGAKIGAHFQMPNGKSIEGSSDTNGLFTMEDKSRWKMHYGVSKEGYYSTVGEFAFGNNDGIVVKDGKWQPWNPEVMVVLRPILNPIPMYAKRVDTKIPATNELLGYDLVVGDWVPPYGKGQYKDLGFFFSQRITSDTDYEGNLRLNFAEPFNGILENNEVMGASEFRFPRYAPEAGYITNWLYQVGRNPTNEYFGNQGPGDDKSYFLRVRSKIDEKGQLKEALYGKVQGVIRVRGIARKADADIILTYYLNPTPNDRNLEFDPKKNLFKDLKSTEQVNMP